MICSLKSFNMCLASIMKFGKYCAIPTRMTFRPFNLGCNEVQQRKNHFTFVIFEFFSIRMNETKDVFSSSWKDLN